MEVDDRVILTAVQSRKAVSAQFSSEQILPLDFAEPVILSFGHNLCADESFASIFQ